MFDHWCKTEFGEGVTPTQVDRNEIMKTIPVMAQTTLGIEIKLYVKIHFYGIITRKQTIKKFPTKNFK